LSPHFNSSSAYSSSYYFDFVPSQPCTVSISGTNIDAGNQVGIPSNPTSGTYSGIVTPTPLLPFIVGLSLPNYNQLINKTLLHNPNWPGIPTKLPPDVKFFEGNPGEDQTSNVPSFHMFSSSNSITEDSIYLHLF